MCLVESQIVSDQFVRAINEGAQERYEILGQEPLDFSGINHCPAWVMDELSKVGIYSDKLIKYLIANSILLHEIGTGNPASDRICRLVYSNGYLGWGPLDNWFCEGWSTNSLLTRLPAVSYLLAGILKEEAFSFPRKYQVKDLGGGSGSYAFRTLGILRTEEYPIDKINWECIDLSADALEFGKYRAQEDKYAGSVRFSSKNFMSRSSYPEDSDKADLVVLVGVLCSMTKQDAVKCLEKIKPHARPGTKILAATLLTQSFIEDPKRFQVYTKLGWQLRPKTMDEVKAVFDAAGYRITSINSERHDSQGNEIPGEYAIVTAQMV